VTAGLVLENLALGLVLVCITVLAQLGLTFFVLGLFRRLAASTASRPRFSSTMTASALLVVAILAGHLGQINVWALAFYLLAFFGDFWSAQSLVGETYRRSPAAARAPDAGRLARAHRADHDRVVDGAVRLSARQVPRDARRGSRATRRRPRAMR
jgi:hypothetical protein